MQIPDLIDIKIEESEDEQEEDRVKPSPETERPPPSLASPVGMPVIKMLDVSSVKLRSREPSGKKDSNNEDQEAITRKPAWMNDLKTDNRRSVGIFLEKQELSHIRYLCAIVNVKNVSVDKIFS